MHLHEYQAKALFADYGIAVPNGVLIRSEADVDQIIPTLGDAGWVIKAQVHAGGRGKAGGVKLIRDAKALQSEIHSLLGGRLKTPQTGHEGLPIDQVWVEALTAIERELYLAVLVDRAQESVAFMASSAGGMDIEAVAAASPEKIYTVNVPVASGFKPYVARQLAFALALPKALHKPFTALLQNLYTLFVQADASLVEINPLVITQDEQLIALDAKVNLDSNALYRQPKLAELRDKRQEDAREAEASEYQLNYIRLEGSIGCMVNGAGLAMATMDLIQREGGSPANFLDVGGGATAERVAKAFTIILSDPQVKAVLVNIFGGIVRCDLIAEGIIKAIQEVHVAVPVIVRLEGTNVDEGRKLLDDSGLNVTSANDLTAAAQLAVQASRGEAG